MARVHPAAVVDPRAKLADDVGVGPCAAIGENIEFAHGVEVVSHAHIMGKTSVGARTRA